MKKNDLNFIPTIIQKTMYYCQNVLPMVFDNSLSYLEMIGVMRCKINEIIKAINNQNLNITEFEKLIALKEEEFEKVVNNQLAEVQESWKAYKNEIESDISAFKTEITEDISKFASQLNNFASDLSNFSYRLEQLETGLASTNTNVENVENRVETLETSTATTETNVQNLTNRVNTNESNINTLSGRVSTCEQSIEDNTADIAENTAKITALENADRVGRISEEGKQVVIGETTYTVGNNAEYFNDYSKPSSNTAIGNYSHAEGRSSKAVGNNSHVENFNNYAFGSNSHVGGASCESYINDSFVHGIQNIVPENSLSNGGTVIGRFNNYSETDSNALFVIGNGNENKRSNAFVVLDNGHIIANGVDLINEIEALKGEIEILKGNAINVSPLTDNQNGFTETITAYEEY